MGDPVFRFVFVVSVERDRSVSNTPPPPQSPYLTPANRLWAHALKSLFIKVIKKEVRDELVARAWREREEERKIEEERDRARRTRATHTHIHKSLLFF